MLTHFPIRNKEAVLDCGYRADLPDECVLSKTKPSDEIRPVHRAHLLTYIKLSGRSNGFLMNWKAARIRDSIQPVISHERLP